MITTPNTDIDGTSVALTVVMDNASPLATTSANSDEGNVLDINIDGNGDVNGHTVTLDITGGGSTYNVTPKVESRQHCECYIMVIARMLI